MTNRNAKGLQLAHGRLSREDGARREPEVAREALGRREDAAARADERQITRGLTERRHSFSLDCRMVEIHLSSIEMKSARFGKFSPQKLLFAGRVALFNVRASRRHLRLYTIPLPLRSLSQ